MKKFYGFFDNGKYKVGGNGGSLYVYDQNEEELMRFKGLSSTYRGAFRPGTNVFVAKSICDYLMVYDLDKQSLIKKIHFSRVGGSQDDGFAFSPSGNVLYNVERPDVSTRTQLTLYDGTTFDKITSYLVNDEKVFLRHVEPYEDEIYLFGFMRDANGIYEYPFVSKFEDGEIKDLKRISDNEYKFLWIYKNWEMCGFSEKTAMQFDGIMLKEQPLKGRLKQIWAQTK